LDFSYVDDQHIFRLGKVSSKALPVGANWSGLESGHQHRPLLGKIPGGIGGIKPQFKKKHIFRLELGIHSPRKW
jgi:hypothetical protein